MNSQRRVERIRGRTADAEGRFGTLEESVAVASAGGDLRRLRDRRLRRRLRGRALVRVFLVLVQLHRLRLMRRRGIHERRVEVVGAVVLVLVGEHHILKHNNDQSSGLIFV